MNGLLTWFRQMRVPQRTAFVLAFVLLAHSFDSCSAHLAGAANLARIGAAPVTQIVAPIALTQAASTLACDTLQQCSCELCRSHESPRDGCEVTSETMRLLAGDEGKLAPPVVISVPLGAAAPDIIDLMPVALALLTRAGPDVPPLFSTLCRNPLAGRAPPASV